ncbi:hypothetical protein ICR95_22175 [Priestia megaterium]|uniref:hypothetical protein n=1 Tax=Priestia megaterium TaxID=1404 RepID=UPI00196BAF28|nr:hypothetical protein [Priestia megaterium]QSF32745.1 hypothetical protein ICR95_22175 [Priestia megaterium]
MKVIQALKKAFGFNRKNNPFEYVDSNVVIAPQDVNFVDKPSLTIHPNKPPVAAKPLFMNQHGLNNKPREVLVVQLNEDCYEDVETVRQSIVTQLDKGNVVVVDGARSVSTHIITDSSCKVKKGENK